MKLKKIIDKYKDQKKTLGSHLVAYGASMGLAALASKLSADACGDSSVIPTLVGTISAMGVYWPTFIGGLIIRDRKELKDEDGINWDRVKEKILEYGSWIEKILEYGSWIGVGEALYSGVRGGIQAYMQNEGYEPEVASAVADGITGTTYTIGLPFIQTGVDYLKNKVKRAISKIK